MSAAAAEDRAAKAGGFLRDRRVAAGFLAAVVVVMTPLGARLSLQRAVDNMEKLVYTGVAPSGAIADYLEDASAAALGLLTVGAKYDSAQAEAGELRAGREQLLDAMEERDITGMANANALMVRAFTALKDKLWQLELSEPDVSDAEYYAGQFEGAEGAVGHANYNETVEDFMRTTYTRFPAKLIGAVFGVEAPEVFQ